MNGEEQISPYRRESWRRAGTLVAVSSLAFWFCFMAAYYLQTDRMAAIFAYPIFWWGLIAGLPVLVMWVLVGSRLAGLALCLWAVTTVSLSDAMMGLARFGFTPTSVQDSDKWSCRLLSLDCSGANSIPPDPVEEGRVDIVFLQNLASKDLAYALAQRVFGKYSFVRIYQNSAIIVRSGALSGVRGLGVDGCFSVDWLPTPQSEAPIRLVNISFSPFPANRNLFLPSCWKTHAELRETHLHEARLMLEKLKKIGQQYGEFSVICAGAFNAPARAPLYDLFDRVFVDSYEVAGVGSGASYPRSMPYLRLSRIFVTSPLRVAFVRNLHFRKIDHRAILAEIYQP